MRWTSIALAALIALGGCDGCKPKKRDDAGKVLIWARSADSSTLDPAEVEWGEDAKITQNIYESLITFKNDSVELEGRLAKSWAFSSDGKTLTFELRTGVKFHDGTPFNADAVVFTIQRLIDPNHPQKPKAVPYGSEFSLIRKVEAPGPEKVVFTLAHPSSVILYSLSLFGAAIVSPTAVKKHGEKWAQNPCGTGPYRLARWDRDVKIELEAFPEYWGPKPPIGRVIVIPVLSPQTAIEKLKKGEVHVVDHPTLADAKLLETDPATHVSTAESMNVCYLSFNMRKPPYSDANFRRAVSLALDRGSLNTLGYHGLAEISSNIVPPAIWGKACPTPAYEHNIEKAKEYLAKVKLDSKEVELWHMTFSRPYVPEPQRVAEWVKDQLAKIGLEVKLTGFDKSAYTVKTKEEGHPMCLNGWNADYPHPHNFLYPLLHGASIKEGLNVPLWDNSEFNSAVDQAEMELDLQKRNVLYAKAYDLFRDQMPGLPLVHVTQIIGLAKNVNYKMQPIEYRFYIASFAK